ncbi:MAG: MarR family transcriptional regulator [Myxococcales bacterium]|nr:MarR family transcriptional regulator [Myxococcales bacterium]
MDLRLGDGEGDRLGVEDDGAGRRGGRGREASNADLARRSFVTPQTMVRILDNLTTMELVRRDPDPNHGRILRARLTRKGTKLLAACHDDVLAVEARMLGPLSAAETDQLAQLLERCADALETDASG